MSWRGFSLEEQQLRGFVKLAESPVAQRAAATALRLLPERRGGPASLSSFGLAAVGQGLKVKGLGVRFFPLFKNT